LACEKLKTEVGVLIICGQRRSRKTCGYCRTRAEFACDHPVIRRGKNTDCNRPLCKSHARPIADNVHLCPPHATLYELNGNRLTMEVDVDPLREPARETPRVKLPTIPGKMYHVWKPNEGWLSAKGTNGKRAWIMDRSKAQEFPGGTNLDVTARTYRLEVYETERRLFL
jgi:hypothetical protein